MKSSLIAATVTMLVVGADRSYAQDADIKSAIAAYHTAIESLDMTKMAPLWAHNASVTLINPAGPIRVGWENVQKGWDVVPTQWSQMTITQTEGPYVQVSGNTARSVGIAMVTGKTKAGDPVNRPTLEADVFEQHDGKWLLVSHAASGRPQQ